MKSPLPDARVRALCRALYIALFVPLASCAGDSPSASDPDAALPRVTAEGAYAWVSAQALPNGLIETTPGNDFVSLYDNALAAILFSARGDFARAEAILDFFGARRESELESGPGGFAQFRNAEGNPPEGALRRWMGDNAWLLIAARNYAERAEEALGAAPGEAVSGITNQTNPARYDALAASLEAWLRSLQDESGALIGGYDEGDNPIHIITEGMIDAFNAVPGYDSFHRDLLAYLGAERWDSGDSLLVSWPDEAFPPSPNARYALDMASWGYCAIEGFPAATLQSAERFRVTRRAAATGLTVDGYCFDEDRDTVWLEGTAQMAVAFYAAGLMERGDYALAQAQRALIEEGIDASPSGEPPQEAQMTGGLPYATNPGTGYGTDGLWEGADVKIATGTTIWFLMAAWKIDPFAAGRGKGIPREHRFWE